MKISHAFKALTIGTITVLALSLTGCNDKEEVKTVEYYKEHNDERKAKLEDCKKTASETVTENCINASKAKSLLQISRTGGLRLSDYE